MKQDEKQRNEGNDKTMDCFEGTMIEKKIARKRKTRNIRELSDYWCTEHRKT